MAFSGPAPERINGRLAMLGFVAAVAAELVSGEQSLPPSNHGAAWQARDLSPLCWAALEESLSSYLSSYKVNDPHQRATDSLCNYKAVWNKQPEAQRAEGEKI